MFLDVASAGAQLTGGLVRGVSQSEVSRRCERVESYFQKSLFERTPSGMRALNPVGRDVAKKIEEALGILDSARSRASIDTLRIGFTPVVRRILAAAIRGVDGAAAGIPETYQIREATADVFLALLARRDLDVALGFDLGIDDDLMGGRIRKEVLVSQTLELVIPTSIARRCPKTFAEALSGLRRAYIHRPTTPPRPLASYTAVTEWLGRQQIGIAGRQVGCTTVGELFGLVSVQGFFGLLPPICDLGDPEVQFVVADGLQQKIALHAYYRKDLEQPLRPLFSALRAACREVDSTRKRVHLHDLPKLLAKREGKPVRVGRTAK